MSWHASDEHKDDGKLRHPADGQQWKNFNENHKDFAKEPRNIRFALSTDGMNPFAERSSKHSTWPVILTIYNLPSWLMQKQRRESEFLARSEANTELTKKNKYHHHLDTCGYQR
jgi:hypothetical protein